MIKTILFIIVIAIIAYFIYRSFNESKLKGGAEVYSDEQIWGIVDHVIKKGDYGGSEYIPFNHGEFPDKYKPYLIFEYAKGINAYHKNYEDILKFDNVTDEVSEIENIPYDYKYTYTNKNVKLIIEVSDIVNDIESCYKLIVKCDDFMDTDSSPLYRLPSNDVYSLNSSQNEIYDDYEDRLRVGIEVSNDLNSNLEARTRVFKKDLNSLAVLSDSDNNDNLTIKQSIITPVIVTANENTNINDDDKEDKQEAENNNQTTYKDEANIEQEIEKETEADIDNQESETANLNNQNTEQTDDIEKIKFDKEIENKIKEYLYEDYLAIILNGMNGRFPYNTDLKERYKPINAHNLYPTDDKMKNKADEFLGNEQKIHVLFEITKPNGWKLELYKIDNNEYKEYGLRWSEEDDFFGLDSKEDMECPNLGYVDYINIYEYNKNDIHKQLKEKAEKAIKESKEGPLMNIGDFNYGTLTYYAFMRGAKKIRDELLSLNDDSNEVQLVFIENGYPVLM